MGARLTAFRNFWKKLGDEVAARIAAGL